MDIKKQFEATLATSRALSDAIQAASPIPAGHLYAVVMGQMDLKTFDYVIGLVTEAGIVERKGDLLIWKGTGNENQRS
jgi:hypothetical protein